MNAQTVLAYFFVLVLLYVLFRLLYNPLRWVFRIGYRTLIGAAILWVLNLGGNLLGYHLALNLPTAMVAGLMGIPGVVALFVLGRVAS